MRHRLGCENPNNKHTIRQIEKAQKSLASKIGFPSRQCGKSKIALKNLQMYHGYEIMKEWVMQEVEFVSFEEVINGIRDAWRMTYDSEEEDDI